jgi:hypothetical protein
MHLFLIIFLLGIGVLELAIFYILKARKPKA